jgi:hypothetical protein
MAFVVSTSLPMMPATLQAMSTSAARRHAPQFQAQGNGNPSLLWQDLQHQASLLHDMLSASRYAPVASGARHAEVQSDKHHDDGEGDGIEELLQMKRLLAAKLGAARASRASAMPPSGLLLKKLAPTCLVEDDMATKSPMSSRSSSSSNHEKDCSAATAKLMMQDGLAYVVR